MARPSKTRKILLFNVDRWTAIGRIDFNNAILNYIKGNYGIKAAIKGEFVRGPIQPDGSRYEIPWPVAMYVNKYVHIPYKDIAPQDTVMATRLAILHRDNFICQYCNGDAATWDHIYPQSRGGENTWLNLVTACTVCNGAKADFTLEEIAKWSPEKLKSRGLDKPLKLLRPPFVPDHDPYRRDKKDVWQMLKTGEGVDLGEE